MNLRFFFTMREVGMESGPGAIGSWGFAVGALTMPVCCLVMAHWPRWHLLFAVPVSSLTVATIATLWGLAGSVTF